MTKEILREFRVTNSGKCIASRGREVDDAIQIVENRRLLWRHSPLNQTLSAPPSAPPTIGARMSANGISRLRRLCH